MARSCRGAISTTTTSRPGVRCTGQARRKPPGGCTALCRSLHPRTLRKGRALAVPIALLARAPGPAGTAAPSPDKVQTLEINRSHSGQLARLRVGNVLIIRLPGNPAGGFQWQVGTANTQALRLAVAPQYSPPAAGSIAAAQGTYTFIYQAVQPGTGAAALLRATRRSGTPSRRVRHRRQRDYCFASFTASKSNWLFRSLSRRSALRRRPSAHRTRPMGRASCRAKRWSS